jgi:hypothetical protein
MKATVSCTKGDDDKKRVAEKLQMESDLQEQRNAEKRSCAEDMIQIQDEIRWKKGLEIVPGQYVHWSMRNATIVTRNWTCYTAQVHGARTYRTVCNCRIRAKSILWSTLHSKPGTATDCSIRN